MAVELTDDEAEIAKRAVLLVKQLTDNPDAKAHLERGLKVLQPGIRTTEEVHDAVRAPLMAQIEELKKRQDDRDTADAEATTKRANDEALGRLEGGFARLRKDKGLTAEGEEKLKQFMQDKTVPDPEIAFAAFEQMNPRPKAEQTAWRPDNWDIERDAVVDTKKLFADPEQWGDDMVGQVLLEERRKANGDS